MHSTKLEIESALRKKKKAHDMWMFSQILCFEFKDKLEALGVLTCSFESFSLYCYCALIFVCLTPSLNYMLRMKKIKKIKKCSMTFSLESNMDFTCNKGIIKFLYFVYVVEAFITLNWEAQHKYTSPFASLLLVHIHLLYL